MGKWLFSIIFLLLISPNLVSARVTPNDTFKAKIEQYELALSKISDPAKKEKVKQADQLLYDINQSVCIRFDEDLNRLSAVLEEVKRREGVTETVVAFGQGDTSLDTAAYWLNYAAEAVAYQKIQYYTPAISETNLKAPINSSRNRLEGDLGILKGKILRAKTEVTKAVTTYEKE